MKKFMREIGQQLHDHQRRVSGLALARITDMRERAAELYRDENAVSLLNIPDYVPAGQGIMKVTHFPGLRGVRFPSSIWHGQFGVICNGSLPDASENLPDYLADFKSMVARRLVRGNIESICVTARGTQIDVREGWPDFVHQEVYQALAICAFGADPALDSIRLQLDDRAPESRYNGLVIPRSMPEPLQGPAPAI